MDIYKIIEENEHLLTNKEICSVCKGKCCKQTPCAYYVRDLVISKENILKMLKEGQTSIKVKIVGFKEGKRVGTIPVPMIGIRGRKKEAIDLLSPATRCGILTETGCPLEVKPSGAKVLMPSPDFRCHNILGANHKLVLEEWMECASVLVDVVEEYSQESFGSLYVKDLLKTTFDFIFHKNAISEYNINSLGPILNQMGILPEVIKAMKEQREPNLLTPSPHNINYLQPEQKIYQKIKSK